MRIITKIRLKGLFGYLFKRARMRFLQSNQKVLNTSIFGRTVTLDTRDLEQKYFAEDCVREPENLFVYRSLSRHGVANTFIDIGANCGHVAASVVEDFQQVILFEPNPKLEELLRRIFVDFKTVEIKECAIVGKESIGTVRLTVPEESSGLATLGGTHLSNERNNASTYDVRATTLESEISEKTLAEAYIKVDVEGFEYEVLNSAQELITKSRPIVGFEALSLEAARKCISLFKDCRFYFARFDFLESGGALSNSTVGILRSLITGGAIEVLELDTLSPINLHNFSQIYAVPIEKSEQFENSVRSFSKDIGAMDFSTLKTWSSQQSAPVLN
jgi:FkbM family methyltransferase